MIIWKKEVKNVKICQNYKKIYSQYNYNLFFEFVKSICDYVFYIILNKNIYVNFIFIFVMMSISLFTNVNPYAIAN